MRIAASTYLNSAPLVYSFASGSQRGRAEFLGHEAPSRCATLLRSGACDTALIPVIEYQRQAGLRIIPDVAVASKARVRSVILISRGPIDAARRISLDGASRTSQALVQILCVERYRITPILVERRPDAPPPLDPDAVLADADAALVIGDPAMRLAARAAADSISSEAAGAAPLRVYDLAEEWRALTGLPFVFAVWATRASGLPHPSPATPPPDFVAAKHEGIAHIDEIAARYAQELSLPDDDMRQYLRENVNYDLDADNVAGMREFFRLAGTCGIIDQVRDLTFA